MFLKSEEIVVSINIVWTHIASSFVVTPRSFCRGPTCSPVFSLEVFCSPADPSVWEEGDFLEVHLVMQMMYFFYRYFGTVGTVACIITVSGTHAFICTVFLTVLCFSFIRSGLFFVL